jgi:hypothetical protein
MAQIETACGVSYLDFSSQSIAVPFLLLFKLALGSWAALVWFVKFVDVQQRVPALLANHVAQASQLTVLLLPRALSIRKKQRRGVLILALLSTAII